MSGVRGQATARATISRGHQITIPVGPFTAAGLTPGDRFEVTAEGEGALRIDRVHRAEAVSVQAQPDAT